MRLTATCPAGLEPALEREWRALGVDETVHAPGSVSVPYQPSLLYRAHEELRTASRLLLELAQGPATDASTLYDFIHSIEWENHFLSNRTLAVRATGSNRELRHTRFIAQQTKDAIVDRLRARTGRRPDVDLESPDLRAFVHVHAENAWAGIDVSGEGLHRRGYRQSNALAPLRENLAAGLLYLCDWPDRLREGTVLFDPMCGSGTLVIEALLIAAHICPGAQRRAVGLRSGFEAWAGHDADAHRVAIESNSKRGTSNICIRARDISQDAVASVEQTLRTLREHHALQNVDMSVELGDFFSEAAPIDTARPLLVTNPPYGERLGGHLDESKPIYRRIGDTLKQQYANWDAWIVCGSKGLAKAVGLRAEASFQVMHGGMETKFCHFPIRGRTQDAVPQRANKPRGAEAQMFENRLRKNWKKLHRQASKQGTTAFRVYDRDIPEFNLSVDWYAGRARVEERERPRNVAEHDADRRRRAALDVVQDVMNLSHDEVTFRVRSRDQGQQEQRLDADDLTIVEERGLRFEINLKRYLDTGLFLDGAQVRQWIREQSSGRRFLNLFSYTCTASIAAAAGGATSCTNVDLSKTALGWGARNARLNDCHRRQNFVHSDVVPWLARSTQTYDLVYAGVPTYSASKQAERPFDAVRGQHRWLPLMMKQLAQNGCLILSTHARDFQPDSTLRDRYSWEDRSGALVATGFRKSPLSQKVYVVRHSG